MPEVNLAIYSAATFSQLLPAWRGVFCQSAIESAQNDHTAVATWQQDDVNDWLSLYNALGCHDVFWTGNSDEFYFLSIGSCYNSHLELVVVELCVSSNRFCSQRHFCHDAHALWAAFEVLIFNDKMQVGPQC